MCMWDRAEARRRAVRYDMCLLIDWDKVKLPS
jgi:hypothetical protein